MLDKVQQQFALEVLHEYVHIVVACVFSLLSILVGYSGSVLLSR
jgi:hypothetical protein